LITRRKPLNPEEDVVSITSGWSLASRLAIKHFGTLGDRIAAAIAQYDPETATEADRDRLQELLRESATKLASARTAHAKEAEDVSTLKRLIETDERAVEVLLKRLAEGTITEAAVNTFCDELEANKARLPLEEQEAADAKAFLDELQQVVDELSKQLTEFDSVAKKAKQQLASAKAQQDLQELRLQRQAEVSSLRGVGTASTALAALTRKAAEVKASAEGAKLVADLQQKPLDHQREIDDIRQSVASGSTGNETAADRLRRLASATSYTAVAA
jgi:hypothetical protein